METLEERFPLNWRESSYLVLSGIVILYFGLLHIGKFKQLDFRSGNPYEKARDYIQNHLNPNDFIIESIDSKPFDPLVLNIFDVF